MKSKQLIILTAILWLLSSASYGQGKPSSYRNYKTNFGIKAGVNLANINNGQNNIMFSPEMKTDFHIGVVANIHFGKQLIKGSREGSLVGTGLLAIQPELLYSRQGFKVNNEITSLDYISLPIMVKVYVFKHINIEAGPYFSYMLSASPNSSVVDGAQIAISDLKGSKDIGLAFGLGLQSESGLTLNARYNYGMSEMTNNLKWKNNVIAISLGWLFLSKKK